MMRKRRDSVPGGVARPRRRAGDGKDGLSALGGPTGGKRQKIGAGIQRG